MTPDQHLAADRTLVDLMRTRAQWYREGCPGLADGGDYRVSGDMAADIGDDIRHLTDALARRLDEVTRLRDALDEAKMRGERASGHLRHTWTHYHQQAADLDPDLIHRAITDIERATRALDAVLISTPVPEATP